MHLARDLMTGDLPSMSSVGGPTSAAHVDGGRRARGRPADALGRDRSPPLRGLGALLAVPRRCRARVCRRRPRRSPSLARLGFATWSGSGFGPHGCAGPGRPPSTRRTPVNAREWACTSRSRTPRSHRRTERRLGGSARAHRTLRRQAQRRTRMELREHGRHHVAIAARGFLSLDAGLDDVVAREHLLARRRAEQPAELAGDPRVPVDKGPVTVERGPSRLAHRASIFSGVPIMPELA